MNDAVAVALKLGAPLRRFFLVLAAARFGAELSIARQDQALAFFKLRAGARHGALRLIGGQKFLDGDAAQLKEPADSIFDKVVGTRGARGDADGDLAGGKPVASLDFLVLNLVVVLDEFVRNHLGGV